VKEASKAEKSESEAEAEDEFAGRREHHRSSHRSSLRGHVSHRSLYSRYQDYCRGPRSGRKLKICIVIDMVQRKLADSELNLDEVDNDKLLHAFMSHNFEK
jgi:ribosome assembly protein YihI (activator of Der GTPase)